MPDAIKVMVSLGSSYFIYFCKFMLMFTLYTNSPVLYELDSFGRHQPGVINEIWY